MDTNISLLMNLNALAGGFFLVCAFFLVAGRQIGTCIKFFILESFFLACSAFLVGVEIKSFHLIGVGIINLITKVILIPYVLKLLLPSTVYTKREIEHVLNIPSSLIVSLILTIIGWFFAYPIMHQLGPWPALYVNIPIGISGFLLGAFTLTIRREAIPQLLGILAMENGAFFAGISLAPDLSVITELVAAFDILILVFVIGVLTRKIHEQTGTTFVGILKFLREEAK
ncbi:hypothetical protein JCM13304A_12920 [Desulfothermus okinawensis JCM 13304]